MQSRALDASLEQKSFGYMGYVQTCGGLVKCSNAEFLIMGYCS
jgi:hypothetical protein